MGVGVDGGVECGRGGGCRCRGWNVDGSRRGRQSRGRTGVGVGVCDGSGVDTTVNLGEGMGDGVAVGIGVFIGAAVAAGSGVSTRAAVAVASGALVGSCACPPPQASAASMTVRHSSSRVGAIQATARLLLQGLMAPFSAIVTVASNPRLGHPTADLWPSGQLASSPRPPRSLVNARCRGRGANAAGINVGQQPFRNGFRAPGQVGCSPAVSAVEAGRRPPPFRTPGNLRVIPLGVIVVRIKNIELRSGFPGIPDPGQGRKSRCCEGDDDGCSVPVERPIGFPIRQAGLPDPVGRRS